MLDERSFAWLATSVPAAPALAFVLLALYWAFARAPSERLARNVVLGSLLVSLGASLGLAVMLLFEMHPSETAYMGAWFHSGNYAFEMGWRIDALSVGMTVLVASITALIGHFSKRYLHAQPGFARFFLLLALFATGMQLLVMGAGIDQLFVGWELVGLTSALLVGFFHHRRAPVQAALRVFVTYRLCDLGLLVGAVLLHQSAHNTELEITASELSAHEHFGGVATTLLPLALLLAAMGKSAQFPMGSWLPRAMEGPTPSSALFYGALSVHAGVYLLLRSEALFAASAIATAALIWVGATTALYGGLVARVQTDAKSALAYATMTQVGLMFVEIGLGFTTLATVHLVAHAILRTLQLLRAPSALRDMEALREAGALEDRPNPLIPRTLARKLYWLVLDRFHLVTLHERFLVDPVLALGRRLDRLERRFLAKLSGWGVSADEAGASERVDLSSSPPGRLP